jgi:hypothetical protein
LIDICTRNWVRFEKSCFLTIRLRKASARQADKYGISAEEGKEMDKGKWHGHGRRNGSQSGIALRLHSRTT